MHPNATQGFFASLPRSIAALLRAVPCVPSEAGELVAPTQAAVRSSSGCWRCSSLSLC
jgi:hypothetical protein